MGPDGCHDATRLPDFLKLLLIVQSRLRNVDVVKRYPVNFRNRSLHRHQWKFEVQLEDSLRAALAVLRWDAHQS